MVDTEQQTIADVLLERLGADVERFDDAGSTLRDEGAAGVHQLRVACRRLRGDLRLFRDFLDSRQTQALRADLRALAGELGPARDLAVHRHRVSEFAAAAPPDTRAGLAEVDALLARRERHGLARASAAVQDGMYQTLHARLRRAVRTPPTTDAAQQPAARVLPQLVYESWETMHRRLKWLDESADDEGWHQARIRAKQTRYAAECAEPVIGKQARRLAEAAKALQDQLGRHQDAVVSVSTLGGIAADRRVRPTTADAARWLLAREEAELAAFRADLEPVRKAQAAARHAARALAG